MGLSANGGAPSNWYLLWGKWRNSPWFLPSVIGLSRSVHIHLGRPGRPDMAILVDLTCRTWLPKSPWSMPYRGSMMQRPKRPMTVWINDLVTSRGGALLDGSADFLLPNFCWVKKNWNEVQKKQLRSNDRIHKSSMMGINYRIMQIRNRNMGGIENNRSQAPPMDQVSDGAGEIWETSHGWLSSRTMRLFWCILVVVSFMLPDHPYFENVQFHRSFTFFCLIFFLLGWSYE